ncbi:MAG: DNA-directed RNA polymerase, omega subunit family protein [candidate division TM6 bacterium GW2011_GWF2_32_72]|nr:MAG: DNA-directed RNA polymerase, omega subunit family protein [candidate division TM6 bacterium GW2011_GWF2_32_72]
MIKNLFKFKTLMLTTALSIFAPFHAQISLYKVAKTLYNEQFPSKSQNYSANPKTDTFNKINNAKGDQSISELIQEKLEKNQSEITKIENELTKIENDISESTDTINKKNIELKEKTCELEAQNKNLQNKHDKYKELNALYTNYDNQQSAIINLPNQTEKLCETSKKLEQLKQEKEKLTEQMENQRTELNALQQFLNLSDCTESSIKQTKDKLQKAKTAHENNVKKTEKVIADAKKKLSELDELSKLDEYGAGACNLTEYKKTQQQINSLNKNLESYQNAITNTEKSIEDLKELSEKFKQFNQTESALKQINQDIRSQENTKKQCEDEVKQYQEIIEKAGTAINLNQLNPKLNNLKKERSTKFNELKTLEAQINQTTKELEKSNKEIYNQNKILAQQKDQYNKTTQELKKLKQQTNDLSNIINEKEFFNRRFFNLKIKNLDALILAYKNFGALFEYKQEQAGESINATNWRTANKENTDFSLITAALNDTDFLMFVEMAQKTDLKHLLTPDDISGNQGGHIFNPLIDKKKGEEPSQSPTQKQYFDYDQQKNVTLESNKTTFPSTITIEELYDATINSDIKEHNTSNSFSIYIRKIKNYWVKIVKQNGIITTAYPIFSINETDNNAGLIKLKNQIEQINDFIDKYYRTLETKNFNDKIDRALIVNKEIQSQIMKLICCPTKQKNIVEQIKTLNDQKRNDITEIIGENITDWKNPSKSLNAMKKTMPQDLDTIKKEITAAIKELPEYLIIFDDQDYVIFDEKYDNCFTLNEKDITSYNRFKNFTAGQNNNSQHQNIKRTRPQHNFGDNY